MLQLVNLFISHGWLYIMLCIGLYLIITLYLHAHEYDKITQLVILAMLILVFHVWEEWIIPGGFHWIYNIQHGSSPSLANVYPMNQLTDMITNFGGELLGLLYLLFRKKFTPAIGLSVGLFSLFEFVIHVWITIGSYQTYGGLFYAPGLVTATLGFLPVGIMLMKAVISLHPNHQVIMKGFIILILMSILFVKLPESFLKSPSSPYQWHDHGYYNQFLTK